MSTEGAKENTISTLVVDVDASALTATLALLEQITAAANTARAALAAIGAAPASIGECVAGELVRDETPAAVLAELREQSKLLRAIIDEKTSTCLRVS